MNNEPNAAVETNDDQPATVNDMGETTPGPSLTDIRLGELEDRTKQLADAIFSMGRALTRIEDAPPPAARSPGRGDLVNLFSYHATIGSQPTRYKQLRGSGLELAESILDRCPPSAERTIAIRKLQEAIMFANAAIAINETDEHTAHRATPYATPE